MPSSITLTVSHLPTSTSFFLSALQPLSYHYVGRSNATVGFGPTGGPADFWITQEIPGVPASAAHVAFPAASREQVQYFFTAALKAGGKIHGDPCVRDNSGYYSAAVIDFDGNSIEAVHKPSSQGGGAVASAAPSRRTEIPAAPEMGGTSAKSSESARKGGGDLFEGLLADARNAVSMARGVIENCRPHDVMPHQSGHGDGKAIVGTLLGVAAGAALTYAVSREDKDSEYSRRRPYSSERSYTEPARSAYHGIDAHNSTFIRSRSKARSHYSTSPRSVTVEEIEYAPSRSHTNRVRRHSDASGMSSSRAKSAIKMIEAPPRPAALTELTGNTKQSGGHRSKLATTIRPLDRTSTYLPPAPSSKYSKHTSGTSASNTTSRREPKDFALPTSRGTTVISSRARREPQDYPLPPSRANTFNGREAVDVAPTEPISHIGSSRKNSKAGSKHSKMDLPVAPDDSISQVSSVKSDRTIRASERRSRR